MEIPHERTPLPDDAFTPPDEEKARRIEEEMIPKTLREEAERGEDNIRSSLSDAERAILDGDDSIFGYPDPDTLAPPPDKK